MSQTQQEPEKGARGGPPRAGLIVAVVGVIVVLVIAVASRTGSGPANPAMEGEETGNANPAIRSMGGTPPSLGGGGHPRSRMGGTPPSLGGGGTPPKPDGGARPRAGGPTPAGEDPPAGVPGVTGPGAGGSTPAPRSGDLPPDHPPVVDEGAQVTLQWLGYSCFYLHSPGGTAVVADPYSPLPTGLPTLDIGAHAVTMSSDDPRHNNTGAVRAFEGEKRELIQGRETALRDVRIVPVPLGSGNTANVFEMAGLRIAHLGDLRRVPSEAELTALGSVDILLLPVGEGPSPKQLVQLSERLKPKVVIPMAYAAPGMTGPVAELRPVHDFVTASPYPVTAKDSDVILVSESELPPNTEVWTLKYRR